jgi:hypothetical protein
MHKEAENRSFNPPWSAVTPARSFVLEIVNFFYFFLRGMAFMVPGSEIKYCYILVSHKKHHFDSLNSSCQASHNDIYGSDSGTLLSLAPILEPGLLTGQTDLEP